MPRTCTICTHPDRSSIDQALIGGEPFRHIANRFGTSTASLQRHKTGHLPLTLRKAHDAEEVAHADDLLDQVRELQTRAMRILYAAEGAGDLRAALGAIREARGVLGLQMRLAAEDKGEEQPRKVSLQVLIQNTIALPKVGAGVPRSLPSVRNPH